MCQGDNNNVVFLYKHNDDKNVNIVKIDELSLELLL